MSPKGDKREKEKVQQENDAAGSRFSKFRGIKNSKFSRPQLVGFILVFAVIGGYIIFRSFAAAPVVATIQAEQMTPSGVNSTSDFTTSLTNGMSLSAPYMWTFNPGVATTAGYFWADGKLLAKVSGPGPYAFRLSSGLLTNGTHSFGHAWDTTSGTHQTPTSSYDVTVSNNGATGFVTSLTSKMTINPPYIWAFDPGIATSAGYFYADGKVLSKITGPGPYVYDLPPGLLSVGSHKLGHAWDTTSGKHLTPHSNYSVTVGSPVSASTSVNYSIINDSSASGGQAVKFGSGVSISGSVSLSAPATSLTVTAHGEQCSTSWPQMSVAVDGNTVINTAVSSTSWTGYTANLNLTAGTHTLKITDTSGGSCLPNLYLDVTNFFGQVAVTPPPTVALSASPASVTAGQASILTWSSTNATACTASGAWSGSEATSGSTSSGALNQSSTYTLNCTGPGGTASASASVSVTAPSNCVYSNTAWCNATNFPTPAFTPTRTIDVSSQSAFMTAWNNIQPGDQLNVHGVTFTGEVVLANKKLSNWAQISFDSNTHFVGPSTVTNVPSVWIHDDSHIRFYGGDFNSSASGGMAGGAILLYGNTYITMWNFKSHDTGGDGISIFPVSSVDDHLDIKGEVYDWGKNLSWDPHTDKGSGLHGMNIGDANYGVTNSRIALYAHDGAAGAGIEWGGKDTYGNFQNNTFYAWCQNLTFVAVSQTGGNCMQVWGQNVFNNTISYLEAENLQGRPYNASGMYSGQSLTTDTVQYGRASSTNLNTAKFGSARWDTTDSTVFKDVSPLP